MFVARSDKLSFYHFIKDIKSESIIRRIIITLSGFYALHTVKKRNKRMGSTFWATVPKLKELQSKSKYHWIGKSLTIPTM